MRDRDRNCYVCTKPLTLIRELDAGGICDNCQKILESPLLRNVDVDGVVHRFQCHICKKQLYPPMKLHSVDFIFCQLHKRLECIMCWDKCEGKNETANTQWDTKITFSDYAYMTMDWTGQCTMTEG